MRHKIACVKCGEKATKIVEEVGIQIPLCTPHYEEFIDEEDSFIDNVSSIEEEED